MDSKARVDKVTQYVCPFEVLRVKRGERCPNSPNTHEQMVKYPKGICHLSERDTTCLVEAAGAYSEKHDLKWHKAVSTALSQGPDYLMEETTKNKLKEAQRRAKAAIRKKADEDREHVHRILEEVLDDKEYCTPVRAAISGGVAGAVATVVIATAIVAWW